MSDGSAELQIAIYDALSGLSPALGTGVFAPAPQDQSLPYVEIGAADTNPADVQCRDGLDEVITVHVWAEPDDQVLPKQMMSRIREALHFADLPVPGRSSVNIRVGATRLFPDADGASLHGVMSIHVDHFGPKES